MMRPLALLGLCAAFSTPAFANLIVDGNFEDPSLTSTIANPGGKTLTAGSSGLPGWTIGGTSIDLIRNFAGAISDISVDMLGTPGPGSLSQMFSTTVGQTYQLSFDLGFNTGGQNGNQPTPDLLGVTISDALPTNFFGTSSPKTYTIDFTATSPLTSLTFTSATSGYSGAVLDNVSVDAVPEPGGLTLSLAGFATFGWMYRRGFGRRFAQIRLQS